MKGGIVLGVLVFLLVVSLLSLYENLPLSSKARVFVPVNQSEIIEQSSYYKGSQFYFNMRFNHLPITYFFDPSCAILSKSNMFDAMNFLDDKANVTFKENKDNPDIVIGCSERYMDEENQFIAGEGGPTVIVNTSLYYVIEKGNIKLYTAEDCGHNIELHELLHVLGFDHSQNINSVMYNVSSCQQEVTHDIIDELIRLYSQEPLPDLYIEKINASRVGKYLGFEAGIKNQGLVDATNVSITLFSDSKKLYEYDFGDISLSVIKTLYVENIAVGKIDRLIFKIDAEDKVKEINEENNRVELALID